MPPKKIVTLGSLSKEGEDRYSSSGEDVDDQQYFVGGGKNSGLVVQGSPSPTRDRRVTQLIDKIKEKAAQGSASKADATSSATAPVFRGQGIRLNNSTDSEITSTSGGFLGQLLSSFLPMSSLADAETLPVVVRLVTFWQDGFSISHLPSSSSASQDANEIEEETEITFYSYQEKENEILLQTILSGHAPLGPLQVQLGQRVELKILDNKNQKYTLKKKETKLLPFSGQGSRLGAYTGDSMSSSLLDEPTTHSMRSFLELDPLLPQTQLQIRTISGERIVAKFQTNHTLDDVRSHLGTDSSLIFQFGFPPKTIAKEDEGKSLSELGLLNATLIQKHL